MMAQHRHKLLSVLQDIEERGPMDGLTNEGKKALYTELELALVDAEGGSLVNDDGVVIDAALDERLGAVRKALRLKPLAPRLPFVLYWLDVWFRFAGVNCGFFTISILSLPILVLQVVDDFITTDPYRRVSETMRALVAQLILVLSGIVYKVQGLDKLAFNAPCTIFAFTHASNLDGLLVASTCPVRHYALAKKELFFVPFFSWISFAIGGVPVDRGNRERAIAALDRACGAAASSKACIVVAPEGTRSLSGNLAGYKKGMFHMQKDMTAPIVPFIIHGAYDLYPVGSWVNQCGVVSVEYLPAIKHDEKASRNDVRRACRRSVLQHLARVPAGTCNRLTVSQWLCTYAVNLANFCFVYMSLAKYKAHCMVTLGMSAQRMIGVTMGSVFAITFALFFHFTYLVHLFSRKKHA